jgi:uncharacterized cupredoxin-like copper-binding protein
MPRLRVTLLSLAIAATAAACGTSASTFSAPASAAAPSAAQPSASPTAPTVVSAAAVAPAPAVAPTISLYEWKVIAPTTIKAGKSTFTISNFGTAPHELLMFKSDREPSAYPTDAAGNIKEEGAGVKLASDGENIDPAGSQVRTVDLTPGTYLFVCNIPGHFKHGMFTVVTVTP